MKTKLMALAAMLAGLAAAEAAESYTERYRPQFHFTPAKNWMNDPNGMVYYEGEYHLFYQYNPFGDKWGHMSWGHAVSKDMVHWEHLPLALAEENDVMIFSGSAVIDWNNTSGFGKDGKPPMVAIYTGHYTKKPLQNQWIAYSNDRGRSWTKYAGNPVLDIGKQDFRDPKVIWHEATKRWVMTVALPTERKAQFYSSPDLKAWTHLSDFGPAGAVAGIWECPDMFPIGRDKWILIVNLGGGAPAGGSGTQYFVGEFDGREFKLDPSYPKPEPEFVPQGTVLADFEGENYGEWTATGTAFGKGPARGTLPSQQAVGGFHGKGLVNSYLNGDSAQGTLTSPVFEITGDYISFLIGGGRHKDKTCMNLKIAGQTMRTATGEEAEQLAWKSWNVRGLRGRKAKIEIVDAESGGWGHINVDQIVMADSPARPATQPALWADYAPDFYAAVSWSDLPKSDGRRVWIGWMSGWPYAGDVPTMPWRSAMSIPREIALVKAKEGLRMAQKPLRELEKLRGERAKLNRADLAEANDFLKKHQVGVGLWEIEAEFEPEQPSDEFGLRTFAAGPKAAVIKCNLAQKKLTLDRTRAGKSDFNPRFSGAFDAPLVDSAKSVRLRIFIDTSSMEIFAEDGRTVLTSLVLPEGQTEPIQLFSAAKKLKVRNLSAWKLKAAVPILEAK